MKNHLEILKEKLIKSGKSLDVPKVDFESLELQIEVGKWLEILNTLRVTGNKDFKMYSSLETSEIIKEKLYKEEDLKKINLEFGKLLKLVGVEVPNICFIKDFNKEDLSFKCHFINTCDDAIISLRYGSFMDESPKFIIDYRNVIRNYDYYRMPKDSFNLELQHFTIKNPTNGNSCKRFLSPYSFYIDGFSGKYHLSLSISEPWNIRSNHPKGYIHKFDNEEKLQSLLLELTYPCNINDLFNNIINLLGISEEDLKRYEEFKLEIEKEVNQNKKETTDEILIKDGKLSVLTITKNDITISYNEEGTVKCVINNYSNNTNVNEIIQEFMNNEILELMTPQQKRILKKNE